MREEGSKECRYRPLERQIAMAESKVLKIYIEKVQCANKDGSLALEGLENTEAFVRGASLACPQKRVVKSVVL